MALKPYQERVVQEKKELDEKMKKLHLFVMSEASKDVPSDEFGRLTRQHSLMMEYSRVLGERIANFTG